MGSFMSSAYATPEEEDSGPVLAVHSKATWDERLEDNRRSASKLMVVDFTATWCGPCRMILPVFKQMACRFTGVEFVKIDVDELPDVAKAFDVKAMPTFVFVKGGKEVSRLVGAKKDELQRKIEQEAS